MPNMFCFPRRFEITGYNSNLLWVLRTPAMPNMFCFPRRFEITGDNLDLLFYPWVVRTPPVTNVLSLERGSR